MDAKPKWLDFSSSHREQENIQILLSIYKKKKKTILSIRNKARRENNHIKGI